MQRLTTVFLFWATSFFSVASSFAAPFSLVSTSGDLVVEVRDDNGSLFSSSYQGIEYFNQGAEALLFINGWSLRSEQAGPNFVSYVNNNMRGDEDVPMEVSSDGTTVTAVGNYIVSSPFLSDPVEVRITRTYTLIGDSVLRISTTFQNLLTIPATLRFANSYRGQQGIDVPGNGFPAKFSDRVEVDVDGTIVEVATASASDTPFSTGNPVDTFVMGSLDPNTVVEGGGSTIFTSGGLDFFFATPDDDNGQFNFDNSNIGREFALGPEGSDTQSYTFTFDLAFGKTPDDAVQSFVDANLDPVIEIEIDVKPGSDVNPLNLKSKGVLPVAVLTTDDFDALTVDTESALLAADLLANTTPATKSSFEDVDSDGDLDLLLFFDLEALVENGSVDAESTSLILFAEDTGGVALIGMDLVTIKPKQK